MIRCALDVTANGNVLSRDAFECRSSTLRSVDEGLRLIVPGVTREVLEIR